MNHRRIKTQFDKFDKSSLGNLRLGGWLQGRLTYLWVGNDTLYATLSGQRLYRLAKAIVKQFENDKEEDK